MLNGNGQKKEKERNLNQREERDEVNEKRYSLVTTRQLTFVGAFATKKRRSCPRKCPPPPAAYADRVREQESEREPAAFATLGS